MYVSLPISVGLTKKAHKNDEYHRGAFETWAFFFSTINHLFGRAFFVVLLYATLYNIHFSYKLTKLHFKSFRETRKKVIYGVCFCMGVCMSWSHLHFCDGKNGKHAKIPQWPLYYFSRFFFGEEFNARNTIYFTKHKCFCPNEHIGVQWQQSSTLDTKMLFNAFHQIYNFSIER